MERKNMITNEENSIAMTGTTSFTGVNIANCLSLNNFKVYASFPGVKRNYIGLKSYRLSHLVPSVKTVESIISTDDSIIEWIQSVQPKVWIHHFHFMKNWRTAEYDLKEARRNTLDPLMKILKKLKEVSCHGIIYSSSVAESPVEQAHLEGKPWENGVFSAYAVSKYQAWQEIKKGCLELNIPLVRIVIPNPIGPGENPDRLIPNLVQNSLSEKSYTLNNPNFMTHNIPIELLSEYYVEATKEIILGKVNSLVEINPKTWSIPVLNFCEIINSEMFVKRLGWKVCQLNFDSNKIDQTNYEMYVKKELPVSILKHFDTYASWLANNENLAFYK